MYRCESTTWFCLGNSVSANTVWFGPFCLLLSGSLLSEVRVALFIPSGRAWCAADFHHIVKEIKPWSPESSTPLDSILVGLITRQLKDRVKLNQAWRHIYVFVDSFPVLFGWLHLHLEEILHNNYKLQILAHRTQSVELLRLRVNYYICVFNTQL